MFKEKIMYSLRLSLISFCPDVPIVTILDSKMTFFYFAKESLSFLGPEIWNIIPVELKQESSL